MAELGNFSILLVEDDRVDVMDVHRALEQANLKAPLQVVSNGLEALEVLRRRNVPPFPTDPILVLLDLNLPRMNGLEFLQELRQDPELRDTVVFVLTTSNARVDQEAAHALGIAGYVVKDGSGEALRDLTRMLASYRSETA